MRLLFVTAYKHLGRESWESSRSFELYMNYFQRIVHLDPICFCDEPHASIIREQTGLRRVLPYNEQDTFFPKYLERQREIIERPETQEFRDHWPAWPAYQYAEYGLVNFSKISLVRRASELFPDFTHYAWIDFGYAKSELCVPPVWDCQQLIEPDKIIIGSCRDLFVNGQGEQMYGEYGSQDRSKAVRHEWNNPRNIMFEKHLIQGNLWFIPKHLIHWFEKELDRSIQRFHELGYASHDEPFWVPIIHAFPERFHLYVKPGHIEYDRRMDWMKVNPLLWVTAYKDIGRSDWTFTKRSFGEYIKAFRRIVHLNPVCFADEPWATRIREQTGHTRIFPFQDADTFIPKYIGRQKEIIEDPEFRKRIPDMLQYNPEFHYPEYGLVNASKTCFIRRASEMFPEYTHYSWIDFGYAKTPLETPPTLASENLISNDQILISSFRNFGFNHKGEAALGPYGIQSDQLNELFTWGDPVRCLTEPPHLVQGNHWVVPKHLTHWLEGEMKRSIEKHHVLGIVRHDESFFLPIIHEFRDKFFVHVKPYSDVTWIVDWIRRQIQTHFDQIREIIEPTWDEWRGRESYLMGVESLDYDHTMLEKQILLFKAVKNAKRALEIGVHAGHSLLIMLLANPTLIIECIDTCRFSHTEKCVDYLNRVFGNRVRLHKGESLKVLPTISGTFDLVHIDDTSVIHQEVQEVSRLASLDCAYVFDDYDTPGLPELINLKFNDVHVASPWCPHRNCLAKRTGVYSIVVAKYREDISWTKELDNVVIYDKSVPPLKNVGREAETFLRYIVEHYDALPEYVVFLQGNPYDTMWSGSNIKDGLTPTDKATPFSAPWITEPVILRPETRHLPEYYSLLFDREYTLSTITFTVGAQMIVPRHCITHRPLDFYRKLHTMIQRAGNPSLEDPKTFDTQIIDAWMLERLWTFIYDTSIPTSEQFVSKYSFSHLTQDSTQKVWGPIQDDEALMLYSIIRGNRMSRILEVGGLSGYSARNFIEALDYTPDGVVYTVDIHPVPVMGINHKTIIKDAGELMADDIENKPLDMIFFDCHSEVQWNIFTKFSEQKLITDETVIALHDTNLHWHPDSDVGVVHQSVERNMVIWLKNLGYNVFSIRTSRDKHSDAFPYRHGLTVCQKLVQ